jgi:hypothetical protein
MTDAIPPNVRFEFVHNGTRLNGPSLRTFILDTLFHVGHTRDAAAALWETAMTDTGPAGERARQRIEQTTEIRITIEPAAAD